MKKLTFELEFITPAFIGGAVSKRAELRSASFVGLLRWWWRALKGMDDTRSLYEEEAKIFGGHLKNESFASKVFLKMRVKSAEENFIKEDSTLKKHEDVGINYLLYSPLLPKRERDYIKPGTKIELSLIGDEEYLKHWVASLWCLVFLGGIGLRSRRGGGNLACLNVQPNIDYMSFYPTQENLSEWYVENLEKAKSLVGCGKDFCAQYSNLSFSRLMVSSQFFDNWKLALNAIGEELMNFRKENKSKLLELSAFGLPIMHRNRSFQKLKEHQRRASPVIIKLIRLNGKYKWILLRLSGVFSEEKDTVELNGKTLGGRVHYSLIEEFYKRLWNNKLGIDLILSKPESLQKLVERLKKEYAPKKIVLFGSRARGDARKNSDIDIALYTDKPVDTGSFMANVDLVLYHRASERLKEAIKREGVVLYEEQA